ncbi:UMP-CMP kinase [Thelohanellus kitauei]|uniref:UMP-CMP kinase n=1 Tax=Thelohanellus kitauei TaxID=669202 RepID=A0A0C2MYN5_THEKT|nr:UMP-CMP kinase [Thelohanellus kitauei]
MSGAVKPKVGFVLGLPGSGKGTICTYINEKFKMIHMSAGDLLRREMNNNTEIGNRIRDDMLKNTIVPSEVTVSLIGKEIFNHKDSGAFLIDGFPRNIENVEAWNSILGSKTNLIFVLWLECAQKICSERIMKRGQSSGRYDDRSEALERRFQVDKKASEPVVNYYQSHGLLIKIDASCDLEKVQESIDEKIKHLI